MQDDSSLIRRIRQEKMTPQEYFFYMWEEKKHMVITGYITT